MPLQWHQEQLTGLIRSAIMRGVVRGTESIRNEMIRLILETPKTGRVYTRWGVSHQASAPGEPPASDLGQLVNSIRTSYEPQDLIGIVHVGAKHGEYLEFGTARMAPRPFARPAAVNKMPDVTTYIAEEITKGL